ncbi:hypothetical protein [Pontibacter ramchanderi]|uniref:hypothetical protein n=1 Tax=Pontibacter ramchanderi TaxID=1179743 RepID=UPI000C70FEDC|nr:hypothetical protein [Pontibacter ramchanderi]
MFIVILSGVNISSHIRPLLLAFVLLVALAGQGHAAAACGAVYNTSLTSESATVLPDEVGHILTQGKQRLSQDATPPSGLFYGLQKAGTTLKHFTFLVPSDEVIPPYAGRASGRGCFIKYFYRSIQPQAP